MSLESDFNVFEKTQEFADRNFFIDEFQSWISTGSDPDIASIVLESISHFLGDSEKRM